MLNYPRFKVSLMFRQIIYQLTSSHLILLVIIQIINVQFKRIKNTIQGEIRLSEIFPKSFLNDLRMILIDNHKAFFNFYS